MHKFEQLLTFDQPKPAELILISFLRWTEEQNLEISLG